MKYILVVLFSLFLFSCEAPKIIHYSELIEISKTWKEPKVAIWYYQGSDKIYHYFQHRDLGVEDQYIVIKSEFNIQEQVLSYNPNVWRVMPWGPLATKH